MEPKVGDVYHVPSGYVGNVFIDEFDVVVTKVVPGYVFWAWVDDLNKQPGYFLNVCTNRETWDSESNHETPTGTMDFVQSGHVHHDYYNLFH